MFAIFTHEGGQADRIWWAGTFATRVEAEREAGELWSPGDILDIIEV
jgi:hypothetical protein